MTRTITTADLLDALPVGSVVGSALRGVPAAAIRGDLGWALTDQVGRYSSHAVLAALGAAAVLHDPPAPSATREVVEAVLDEVMDEAAYDDGTIAHDTEKRLADALLARFTITPRTDR